MENYVHNQTKSTLNINRQHKSSVPIEQRGQIGHEIKKMTSNISARMNPNVDTRTKATQARNPSVRKHNAFEGSELGESTVTSISKALVEDSQLDSQGHPVGHPRYQVEDHDEVHQEDEFETGEEDDEDGEDGEDEEQGEDDESDPMDIVANAARQPRQTSHFDHLRFDEGYPSTTVTEPSHQGDYQRTPEEHEQPIQQPQTYDQNSRHARRQGTTTIPLEQPSFRRKSQHQRVQQQGYQQHIPTHSKPSTHGGYQAQRNHAAYQQQERQVTPHTTRDQKIIPMAPDHAAIETHRPQTSHHPIQTHREQGTIALKVAHSAAASQATAVPVHPRQTDTAEQEHTNEACDYDDETLESMAYNDLHNQPFDDHPSRPTPPLPKDKPTKPLKTRLQAAQKLDAASQRTFMASLSLTEWDEAGDWFLERFGDILREMKDARKVRREESRKLEEEVLKRHELVERKKRSYDEALQEMRSSGKGLLKLGTPKKARK